MKKLILFISAFLFLQSCTQSKETTTSQNTETKETSILVTKENEEITALQEDEKSKEKETLREPAKEWLESLFKCRNGNQFCFYLETEEKATTKKFYQFMLDSEQIYGATNLSDKEMPLAKKKYKEKWSEIYPLRKGIEPWLFGRGQDDIENIKNVKIENISDLKYRVFVDYGDQYQTLSQVTLVKNKNSYLIDFCETEFLN